MTVGVAVGSDSYAEPLNDFIDFPKLKSAILNIQLPAQVGGALVKSSLNPTAMPGAIYRGLLVGVVGGKGRVIKPVSARWPTGQGKFELVLPASARGLVAKFWESTRQFYSTTVARPGGVVDPAVYPKSLRQDASQAVATLKLSG